MLNINLMIFRCLRFKKCLPLLRGGIRLLLGRDRVVRVVGRDGGGDEDGEQVQDESEGAEGVREHQRARPIQVQSRTRVSLTLSTVLLN